MPQAAIGFQKKPAADGNSRNPKTAAALSVSHGYVAYKCGPAKRNSDCYKPGLRGVYHRARIRATRWLHAGRGRLLRGRHSKRLRSFIRAKSCATIPAADEISAYHWRGIRCVAKHIVCRRGITADTAFRSRVYFGTTPDFGSTFRRSHDLEAAASKAFAGGSSVSQARAA